jgi:hypothetical protein
MTDAEFSEEEVRTRFRKAYPTLAPINRIPRQTEDMFIEKATAIGLIGKKHAELK